jgi:hypothetical protein
MNIFRKATDIISLHFVQKQLQIVKYNCSFFYYFHKYHESDKNHTEIHIIKILPFHRHNLYNNNSMENTLLDRLCGLVVRLPGCRPRGLGFYSQRCQIF